MSKRVRDKAAKDTPKAKKQEPFYQPFSKLAQPSKQKTKTPQAKQAQVKTKPSRTARALKGREVDSETFAIYMAGVRALEESATRIPATESVVDRASRARPKVDPDAAARSKMRSLVVEGIRFETMDDGKRIEGRRVDVDPRELRRLRRGQYAIDGYLDLHGQRLEEARSQVQAFVRKKQTEGDRVVGIIHGQGHHSAGGHAVLRGEIAAWLSQGRAAKHVAAFATAPRTEGGAGVVLVLLAR